MRISLPCRKTVLAFLWSWEPAVRKRELLSRITTASYLMDEDALKYGVEYLYQLVRSRLSIS